MPPSTSRPSSTGCAASSPRAEEAYRESSRWGREPQPGLAQLRLAQGQVDAAAAAIRRVLDEAQDRLARSRLLAACAEIMLATGDVGAARSLADEQSQVAVDLDAPLLRGVSALAMGAVLLAEGDARAALATLRPGWPVWQQLEVPYEAARVRVLVGLACRQLGDEEGAQIELDAARQIFQRLGATPDLARVGELVISERTAARHMSNIFAKLDVSSRTAATALAFEQSRPATGRGWRDGTSARFRSASTASRPGCCCVWCSELSSIAC